MNDKLFKAFSWSISGTMLILLITPYDPIGFENSSSANLIYFGTFLFFLFFPFIKSIKLGKFIEIERALNEVDKKAENTENALENLRLEFHSTTQTLNTAIQTSSNANAVLNFTIPSPADLAKSRRNLEETSDVDSKEIDEVIEKYEIDEEDKEFALAKIRMRIEKELRRLRKLAIDGGQIGENDAPHRSAGSLMRHMSYLYPRVKQISESIRYVLDICNAAIHAQSVPSGAAYEALEMGPRIIAELQKIDKLPGKDI